PSLQLPRTPTSPPLPYTTLFRSRRAASSDVPSNPRGRLNRVATHDDSVVDQKLYSSPAVHRTLGRRPPWFSGHKVLPTRVIPACVVNLKPNDPLMRSSRSVGMFVTLIVRRKGLSYVTGPGRASLLS